MFCDQVARDGKLKYVTFSISALPPEGTFQMLPYFYYLWPLCQKFKARAIFTHYCIQQFATTCTICFTLYIPHTRCRLGQDEVSVRVTRDIMALHLRSAPTRTLRNTRDFIILRDSEKVLTNIAKQFMDLQREHMPSIGRDSTRF